MASSHSKKTPSRAPLPRRTTRGPLDVDDPLTPTSSLPQSPITGSTSASPRPRSVNEQSDIDESIPLSASTAASARTSTTSKQHSNPQSTSVPIPEKDFSFLLDTSIYHPLSQLDVPPPFRTPFPAAPPPETPTAQIFAQLETLLSVCQFLGAAHLAAVTLTSGLVPPSDYNVIFELLRIRYSGLELSGNVLLAAQEAKALEDMGSDFYYIPVPFPVPSSSVTREGIDEVDEGAQATVDLPTRSRTMAKHIMPFDLRLQALRLQSIGFSDPKRGVSALYDLGLECREYLSVRGMAEQEIKLWTQRLDEVGIRVVNALIEMGDLDCAGRTLESMTPSKKDSGDIGLWTARMVLLYVKMGKVRNAENLLAESRMEVANKSVLESILAVASGRYEDAAKVLSTQLDQNIDQTLMIIARQNLAVAYLYLGRMSECRSILEGLVDENNSFQALTVNLATVYELTSDKARDLKISMATQIASGKDSASPHHAHTNADFRL